MSSSPSSPSSRPPSPASRNPGTMLPTDLGAYLELARRRAVPWDQAYSVAVATDSARAPQTSTGYRLYWMSDGTFGSRDVPAEPGRHLVVGRHTCCDVVVSDGRAVSLRHVLIRASSIDDGCPVLSVLDLRTPEGFELSDGSKQRSIVGTGPIAFRVGVHVLVALPSTGRAPAALPPPVVERSETNPYQPSTHKVVVERSGPISRVTLLPSSVELRERRSVSAREECPSEADRYEIVLETNGRRARVWLTEADVEHGILVGRSPKCLDDGLRAILCADISRVHVLIRREKDGVYLYDTASTQGTFVSGAQVRCVALSDEGTSVRLARVSLRLSWRALP